MPIGAVCVEKEQNGVKVYSDAHLPPSSARGALRPKLGRRKRVCESCGAAADGASLEQVNQLLHAPTVCVP
jgi:hypothetical protein